MTVSIVTGVGGDAASVGIVKPAAPRSPKNKLIRALFRPIVRPPLVEVKLVLAGSLDLAHPPAHKTPAIWVDYHPIQVSLWAPERVNLDALRPNDRDARMAGELEVA